MTRSLKANRWSGVGAIVESVLRRRIGRDSTRNHVIVEVKPRHINRGHAHVKAII